MAVYLVELVLNPLRLEGLLAVRLSDVLPQGHRILQRFRAERVLVPLLGTLLCDEHIRLHDLVELDQVAVVLLFQCRLGDMLVCCGVLLRIFSGVIPILGALFQMRRGVGSEPCLARFSLEHMHFGGGLRGVDSSELAVMGSFLGGDLLGSLHGGERCRPQETLWVSGAIVLPFQLREQSLLVARNVFDNCLA